MPPGRAGVRPPQAAGWPTPRTGARTLLHLNTLT